jgi:hypothetical protein
VQLSVIHCPRNDIYTAALLPPRFGAQQQVYPAIGCIVGLHFIGLWLATRSTQFLRITAGMCFVSLLSMLKPFNLAQHGSTLSADHNRNQAAHLGDRPGEECLNGCETCVKRRTPALRVSCQWKQEKGEQ